jgi:hypothetical protein
MLTRAARFALMVTGVLAALIIGIGITPYDSGRIPNLIDAPAARGDCTAPVCFLNVGIGETGWTRIYAALETHVWVARYSPDPNFGTGEISTGAFSAAWIPNAPAWVDATRPITFWSERGVIVYTRFRSALALGDLWLTYGEPDVSRIVGRGDIAQSILLYAALWRDQHLAASVFITCPAGLAWSQPVTLWRYDPGIEAQLFSGVDVPSPSNVRAYCAA